MARRLLLLAAASVALLAVPAFVSPPSSARGRPVAQLEARIVGRGFAVGKSRPTTSTAAIEEGSGSFGLACRAAGCAIFALLCASSRRAGSRQRFGLVALNAVPSQAVNKKGHRLQQKVLRSLQPFGEIPSWSRKPLLVRHKIKVWRTRDRGPPNPNTISLYGRRLKEKVRVRYHYNITNRQLVKYKEEAFEKGIEYPCDRLLQICESRLDNFVWRVGLAPTMAAARAMVSKGHLQISRAYWREEGHYRPFDRFEWQTCNAPNCRLQIGDKVRVSQRKKTSAEVAKRHQEDEGPVDVPPHLVWDREKLEGEYCDVCHYEDVGMPVNATHLIGWFTGPKSPGRDKHIRYFPGTSTPIPKNYNGGQPRPTPENFMNMARGKGLNKQGRRRPPCLWGTKKARNDPYERCFKTKL